MFMIWRMIGSNLIYISATRFLIGNKCDQEKSISDESDNNFAATYECADIFLTSAKTGLCK